MSNQGEGQLPPVAGAVDAAPIWGRLLTTPPHTHPERIRFASARHLDTYKRTHREFFDKTVSTTRMEGTTNSFVLIRG